MEQKAEKNRIADRVDVNTIVFQTKVRFGGSHMKAVVGYNATGRTLSFNNKMVSLLDMKNWKDVVVGYDKRSQVLVLKNCDPEEVGAVMVRTKPPSGVKLADFDYEKDKERSSRIVAIGNIASALDISKGAHFRAEREGNMIFLEQMKE